MKRWSLLLPGIWEFVRFILLFLIAAVLFESSVKPNDRLVQWILILSSGSLLLPAGIALLMFDPQKYRSVLDVLLLGKVLSLFPTLLTVGSEFLKRSTLSYYPFYIAVGITIMDLISLSILVTFRRKLGKKWGNARLT
jgi:hypothetical protein